MLRNESQTEVIGHHDQQDQLSEDLAKTNMSQLRPVEWAPSEKYQRLQDQPGVNDQKQNLRSLDLKSKERHQVDRLPSFFLP